MRFTLLFCSSKFTQFKRGIVISLGTNFFNLMDLKNSIRKFITNLYQFYLLKCPNMTYDICRPKWNAKTRQSDFWLYRPWGVQSSKNQSWMKLDSLSKGWWINFYVIREYVNHMQLLYIGCELLKNIWELRAWKHLWQVLLWTFDVTGWKPFKNKLN